MKRSIARILMTADTIGGVFSYAVDLADALSDLRIEVVLATMGRAPSAAQRLAAARVASLELVESDYPLEWMDEPWAGVDQAGEWLLALERRHAPDVVHLNGYAHGSAGFRAPVLMVAHSCVCSWWRAVKGEAAPPRYDVYRERVRAGLRAAQTVVAPTRAMRDDLRHDYGPLPQALVVHNACDLDTFAPRAKRGWVVAAGRFWDEAKNLSTLARASETIRAPVFIAGETAPPRGAQGAQGAQGALAGRVTLLGQLSREQLAELLGHASIYALPARYEPFGLSVLEAAASGAALVLGDIPSLRELWQDVALFVDPEDATAQAEAVNTLSADPTLRTELAFRARARAAQFDQARMARRYHALYEQLTSRDALRESAAQSAWSPGHG